jgi:hypothetical protein
MREREMGLFAGSIATYGLWTNSRWRRLVSIRDAVSTALSYSGRGRWFKKHIYWIIAREISVAKHNYVQKIFCRDG